MNHDEAVQKAIEALEDLLPPFNDGYMSDAEMQGFAALALLQAAADPWEPISEKHKDGKPVFLLSKAHMGMSIHGEVECPARAIVGRWLAEGSSWVDEDGSLDGNVITLATTGVWVAGSGWLQPNEVSHAMLIPAPPASGKVVA